MAEEPLSRVSHGEHVQLTGIRLNADAHGTRYPQPVSVYQNRVEHEAYFFVGAERYLAAEEGGAPLRREIDLDQNCISEELTIFL